jgi:hypothetical protein
VNDFAQSVLRTLGFEITAERAESIARAIAAQLEAERAATRDLPFETEPSGFAGELERELHE